MHGPRGIPKNTTYSVAGRRVAGKHHMQAPATRDKAIVHFLSTYRI